MKRSLVTGFPSRDRTETDLAVSRLSPGVSPALGNARFKAEIAEMLGRRVERLTLRFGLPVFLRPET